MHHSADLTDQRILNPIGVLNGFQIIVLESDHGGVVWDMKNRKLLRHLPEFNGEISPDGKLGLYAPVRGGLFVSFF